MVKVGKFMMVIGLVLMMNYDIAEQKKDRLGINLTTFALYKILKACIISVNTQIMK